MPLMPSFQHSRTYISSEHDDAHLPRRDAVLVLAHVANAQAHSPEEELGLIRTSGSTIYSKRWPRAASPSAHVCSRAGVHQKATLTTVYSIPRTSELDPVTQEENWCPSTEIVLSINACVFLISRPQHALIPYPVFLLPPRLWDPPSALLGDHHSVSSISSSLRCAHDLTSSCDAHCRTYYPGVCALAGRIGGHVRFCLCAVVPGRCIIIIIIIWGVAIVFIRVSNKTNTAHYSGRLGFDPG
jgi:hypothetical protein